MEKIRLTVWLDMNNAEHQNLLRDIEKKALSLEVYVPPNKRELEKEIKAAFPLGESGENHE